MSSTTIGAVLERWQVPIYLGAIVSGAFAGLAFPGSADAAGHAVTPAIAALLFVTFLQVPVRSLRAALSDMRFLGALAVVNFVVAPTVVGALLFLVPDDEALRFGVLLVLLCPCIDYVIVFSGLAGARADRLLAATPLLLLGQFLLLPVYLYLFLGEQARATLEPRPFVTAFLALIVMPLCLAWLVQSGLARTGSTRGRARHPTMLISPDMVNSVAISMVPLMALVLVLVVSSQVSRIGDDAARLLALVPCYVAFLVVMPVAGALVSRLCRLDPRSGRSVAFSGATRNSLVVLPLALALPDTLAAAAAAAVITQTLVELVGMVVCVRAIPRLLPDRVLPAA